MNLYTYVRNNPVRYVDPLGLGIGGGGLASGDDDELEIEIGSRPVWGKKRHKFLRWKEESSDEYTYWEMGPDKQRKIAINPQETREETMRYINESPEQVKWAKTTVKKSKFETYRREYERGWVGSSYDDTYVASGGLLQRTISGAMNSNYAVDFVVYGSGGEINQDLGDCPGSIKR